MIEQPCISVIIPVKNGAATLQELLASLTIQTLGCDEILVSDSGSTDDSVAIAEKYHAKIVHIQPEKFDHGGTRSLLVEYARNDIVVFLTQDVILKRKDALERLIAPLVAEEEVACCYGRQFPAFDADHFAASLRVFNYPEKSKKYRAADRKTHGLLTIFISNSFAAYRKSALVEVGYFRDRLIFGEDTIAAAALLEAGFANCYVAEAEAYHSHNYTPKQEFKRYFDIGVLHSLEKEIIGKYGSAEGRGIGYLCHEIDMIRRNGTYLLLPELGVRIFLKYLGFKLGYIHNHLPSNLLQKLSMNPGWWIKEGICKKDT